MSTQEIILAEPVRTAIGAFGGSLKDTPATELGGVVIAEVLRRSKIAPQSVQSVTMGNIVQAGNRMNPARQASIGGGLPVSTPALTVNRVCGSGAQAIVTAAQEIASGHLSLAIAGGMENMDRAPYLLGSGRWGYRMGPAEIHDSMLRDGLIDAFSGEHSGWHTEDLVAKAELTREQQDLWASDLSGALPKLRLRVPSIMRSPRLRFTTKSVRFGSMKTRPTVLTRRSRRSRLSGPCFARTER